jgi:hypothetical protein
MTTPAQQRHAGSCHCGAVRFEVFLDERPGGSRCNCSICTKLGMTGAITKPAALTLIAGEESLNSYEWGGKISRRFFCRHCGVHCFARGNLVELGGAYVSVNLNAVDDLDVAELPIVHWDGRHNNWYAGPRPTPWPIDVSPVAESARGVSRRSA